MAKKPKPAPMKVQAEYTGVVRLSGNGAPTFQDLEEFLNAAWDADVQADAVVEGTIGGPINDPYLRQVVRDTNITIAVPAGPEYS